MQARDLIMGKKPPGQPLSAPSNNTNFSQANQGTSYQPLRSSNSTNQNPTAGNYLSHSFGGGAVPKPSNYNVGDLASKYLSAASNSSSTQGGYQSGRSSGYHDIKGTTSYQPSGQMFSNNFSSPSSFVQQAPTAPTVNAPSFQQPWSSPKPSTAYSPTTLAPTPSINQPSGPAPAFSVQATTSEDSSLPKSFQQPQPSSQNPVQQQQATTSGQQPSTTQQAETAQQVARQPESGGQVQPPSTTTTPSGGQDYSSWSNQMSSIDPKYVGELETNIGKVRLENSNLVARMQQMEHRAVAAEQQASVHQSQVQQLQRELGDQTQLKSKISQLEFQLEAKTREVTALQESSIQIRNQLFTQTFDKFAFETSTRECHPPLTHWVFDVVLNCKDCRGVINPRA